MEIKLGIGDYKIRRYRFGDEATIVKYANNRNVWINLRDIFPHPYTPDDAREWIKWVKRQDPETHFAIAGKTDVIGGIGVVLQRDVNRFSAEIGYWLGEPFWGRGITSRAVDIFSDYVFAEYDLLRVYARVFGWNDASARLLEKCGYRLEGRLRQAVVKDGKVTDELVYARLREEK